MYPLLNILQPQKDVSPCKSTKSQDQQRGAEKAAAAAGAQPLSPATRLNAGPAPGPTDVMTFCVLPPACAPHNGPAGPVSMLNVGPIRYAQGAALSPSFASPIRGPASPTPSTPSPVPDGDVLMQAAAPIQIVPRPLKAAEVEIAKALFVKRLVDQMEQNRNDVQFLYQRRCVMLLIHSMGSPFLPPNIEHACAMVLDLENSRDQLDAASIQRANADIADEIKKQFEGVHQALLFDAVDVLARFECLRYEKGLSALDILTSAPVTKNIDSLNDELFCLPQTPDLSKIGALATYIETLKSYIDYRMGALLLFNDKKKEMRAAKTTLQRADYSTYEHDVAINEWHDAKKIIDILLSGKLTPQLRDICQKRHALETAKNRGLEQGVLDNLVEAFLSAQAPEKK